MPLSRRTLLKLLPFMPAAWKGLAQVKCAQPAPIPPTQPDCERELRRALIGRATHAPQVFVIEPRELEIETEFIYNGTCMVLAKVTYNAPMLVHVDRVRRIWPEEG